MSELAICWIVTLLVVYFAVGIPFEVHSIDKEEYVPLRKLLIIRDRECPNDYHIYAVMLLPIPLFYNVASFRKRCTDNLSDAIDYVVKIQKRKYQSLFSRIMDTNDEVARRRLLAFKEQEIKKLEALQERTKDWLDVEKMDIPSQMVKGVDKSENYSFTRKLRRKHGTQTRI